MKTSLDHLPEHKQQQLRDATDIILKAVKPDLLILFGSYARGDWVEEREVDGIHFRYQSDFDLLAVVKNRALARKIECKDSLDTKLLREIETPVSLIAEDIHFINARLSKNQYFFLDIVKEGVLLHDSGKLELAEPQEYLPPAERRRLAQGDFDYWLSEAIEDLEIYELMMVRKSYNRAAFSLHQATERLYSMILLVFTRYKPKTHDIKKLRALTASVEPEFLSVFPQGTVEERKRFKLLRHAYVSARYDPNYSITPDELEWLAERVRVLQTMAERLCREKIAGFQ
ncbi:HEPN domain-containing protein [Saccharospirillum salsuginis]|uniref:DNA-binding protein n=1 Tax=Saccharospirillum salsuginis TaxID=418750 RepID=A0A918NCN0_9GAMM|nr:HEPN domain-containing protein [Saccharospirillum salsuginis]GGX60411.1 DNA-binding protein [Saccharospirillum salsuginis]